MLKTRKLRNIIICCMSVVVLMFLIGCDESSSGGEGDTLYFIPINETGAYWSVMLAGAQAEAAELGFNLIHRTSPNDHPQRNEQQVGFVREAIAENALAMAIAPIDPDMLDRVVQDATEAGIPVVTFDSDVTTTANRISYIGTDNLIAGQVLGRQAAEHLLANGVTEGSLQVVLTFLSQTTMILRQEGIQQGFNETMGAYASNFTWLEPIADEGQSAVSMPQLESRIVANTDLVAVFSLGAEGPTTGTMEALRSQGKGGIIPHFGFDYTDTWLTGIEDELVTGIVNQDAFEIGRQVVRTMVRIIEGENVADNYPIPVTWVEAADIKEHGLLIQERMGE